ncbi:hypothetical protein O181_054952 [Austropuccinia psidii MF-1]|uniref:Uncharacterized protein n=1 Tax=Austropuccinia psidii MF-1 TaxID=1389203 RepID=A0A9Q3ECN7_9BASI|nr:hypothetical protein [Austropuccinia psidii MF-1]
MHICDRIEYKVTFLNQSDDNSISFIKKQLKGLRIQVQQLENLTGHNEALFQEQLEKSDKARIELQEDAQSSINNISLQNDNAEVDAACNLRDILRLEEWPAFSGEGKYKHMEFMKTIDILKEDFKIPDEYISAILHSFFTKSEKKCYYKMRQYHGKHSWPWWKEKIISKWENDSCRFIMEDYFEEAILNIKRDRKMSWFLKQKDRLTALHPDMAEKMVYKRILRKCGGDFKYSIRSRCIEPCSTEDYINSMEDITTRTKMGKNWYKTPIDNKTGGKAISRPNKPQERAPLKCHKSGFTSHLANTCSKRTRINWIEVEKAEDTKETVVSLPEIGSDPS